MGGKNKGSNQEAQQARLDEEKRQDRIRQGTARVNSIFDGGQSATGQIGAGAAFDPNATYYGSDGKAWTPYNGLMMGDQAKAYAEMMGDTQALSALNAGAPIFTFAKSPQEQFAAASKSGKLYSNIEARPGFDDNFFTGRRQAYLDYATPQLEQQYGDAKRELTFALTRSGLLDSTARAQKEGELQRTYDLNKQQVADKALAYETDTRNQVEDARGNLIATLNATGDAEGAANSAIARASALSKPQEFSPLGQIFTDFTNALGTQAALEKANYYSKGTSGSPRYNIGLFPKTSGVEVK